MRFLRVERRINQSSFLVISVPDMAHILARLTRSNYANSAHLRYLKHYCFGALGLLQEFIRAIDGPTPATLIAIR